MDKKPLETFTDYIFNNNKSAPNLNTNMQMMYQQLYEKILTLQNQMPSIGYNNYPLYNNNPNQIINNLGYIKNSQIQNNSNNNFNLMNNDPNIYNNDMLRILMQQQQNLQGYTVDSKYFNYSNHKMDE
jgi:hypothetical protein